MTRRYWLLLTLTILLALTLAACGGKGNDTPSAKETTAPAAQATARSSAAAETTHGRAHDGSRGCAPPTNPPKRPRRHPRMTRCPWRSRDTGLDALTSYRLTWHAEWKSTDQGKEEQGAWDWTEEYTSDPKAHHLSMSTPDSSDPAKTGAFEMWQIGDTSYMKSGEDAECMSFSTEGAENDIQKGSFNPSMLGSIEDAKYVGRETINGIPTKHYKYNSKTGMLTGPRRGQRRDLGGDRRRVRGQGHGQVDRAAEACSAWVHPPRPPATGPGPGNSQTSTSRSRSSRRRVARDRSLICRSCRTPPRRPVSAI